MTDLKSQLEASKTYNWNAISVYEGRFIGGNLVEAFKPKPGQCRGECSYTDRITHFYPCSHKAKVRRNVEMRDGSVRELGFCGIHDPEAILRKAAKRHAESQSKYQEMLNKWAEEKRVRDSRPDYIAALRVIADGHNDPRSLAAEILSKWNES